MSDDNFNRSATRVNILRVESSLKRLQTDYTLTSTRYTAGIATHRWKKRCGRWMICVAGQGATHRLEQLHGVAGGDRP
ncbi:MAG: hypothetical protein R3E39_15565 [Anaerolineae bacterium]